MKDKSPRANPSGLLPLADEIERLAHSYWEAEGRPDGRHLEHWLRAEAEVSHSDARSDDATNGARNQ